MIQLIIAFSAIMLLAAMPKPQTTNENHDSTLAASKLSEKFRKEIGLIEDK